MKIAIATDTGSGITRKKASELGVYVLPLQISINDKLFYEGVDLNYYDFYQFLDNKHTVTTSQPSPGDIIRFWDNIIDKGYDEIVYIPLSSGLSSSYETASIISEKRYKDKVFVVDNHRISVTQIHGVLSGLDLIKKGLTGKEIKEKLEKDGNNSIIHVGFESLDYLKKGGRLMLSTVAQVGKVLNILPLVTLKNDKAESINFLRGKKKCRTKLLNNVIKELKYFKESNQEYYITIGGTFKKLEDKNNWIEFVKEAIPDEKIYYENLSCSVATHAGPDAFGVGISKK